MTEAAPLEPRERRRCRTGKTQLVDERMSGLSRSQVIAEKSVAGKVERRGQSCLAATPGRSDENRSTTHFDGARMETECAGRVEE